MAQLYIQTVKELLKDMSAQTHDLRLLSAFVLEMILCSPGWPGTQEVDLPLPPQDWN